MNVTILIVIIVTLMAINVTLLLALLGKKLKHNRKKRRSSRLPVNIFPERFYVDGRVDVLLENKACIKNISDTGLAVESDYSMKKNMKILLWFKLPGKETRIEVEGRAMWIGKDFHESISGVKYTHIKNDDKLLINEFIALNMKKE